MDPKDLLSQAQTVWSMLDDLANSDPSAYKKFISKNLEDGRKWMEMPKPMFCVKMKEGGAERVYLNFCSWVRLPKPDSLIAPIPVTATSIETSKDKYGNYKVLALVFNPEVVDVCEKDPEMRSSLINLARNYLRNRYNLLLEEEFKVLNQKTHFKGDEKLLLSLLSSKKKDETLVYQNFLESPSSLLKAVTSPVNHEEADIHLPGKEEDHQPETPNRRLIEEIEMPHGDNAVEEGLEKSNRQQQVNQADILIISRSFERTAILGGDLTVPEFVVKFSEERLAATVTVELPGVNSVSECELEVSQSLIHLEVPGKFRLAFDLLQSKYGVEEETVEAKFMKPKQQLLINLHFEKK